VVADLRNASGAGWQGSGHALKQTAAPGMFVPAAQGVPLLARSGFGFDAHWLVRSRTAPAATARLVADIVQAAEPRLPFVAFESMDQVIGAQIAQERALFSLLAVFAGIAMMLACIGTYGMMAYSVSARSRDVGIRMALGATAARVLTLFLHEGLVVVAAGGVVGLAGAAAVAQGLRAYVWGMEPFDPVTFIAVVLVFVVVVMMAVAVPALRAARLQPARVLRQ
jgi:ABC-type lipoprotein release transport system permease subunit